MTPLCAVRRTPAFTLIEALLYTALAATLIAGTASLLYATLQADRNQKTIAEVEEQGTQAMALITRAVRNAKGVTSPATGASGASLTISTASGSTNPTVFSVSQGTLYSAEGAGQAEALTNNRVRVERFTAENLSISGTPGTVRVTLVLAYQNPGTAEEYTYTGVFRGSATVRDN